MPDAPMPISDNPLDLLEERCKNLIAMLPDNDLRPALEGMLQQLVLMARMAAVIRHVSGITGPLPDHVRETLREFANHADATIRQGLSVAEAEAARFGE